MFDDHVSYEDVLSFLARPFPAEQIKQREGSRGMMFDYIEFPPVVHRLNQMSSLYGLSWDWAIKEHEMRGDVLVCTGSLRIERIGTRDGVGVQKVQEGRSSEDLLKGASSDALKRAGTLFGIGLHLYGVDEEMRLKKVTRDRMAFESAVNTMVRHSLLAPSYLHQDAEGRLAAARLVVVSVLEKHGLDLTADPPGAVDFATVEYILSR